MYYDVNNEVGTVLNVDMLTPVPSYRGLLRLRADLVQQTGRDRFFAHNTTLTSSRAENPGYRLQASDVYFEDIQKPVVNPLTGEPQIDPATGEQLIEHQQMATSKNNFLFLGPVPVFYWPVLATDLSQPSYYLRRFIYKQDQIFGTQYSDRIRRLSIAWHHARAGRASTGRSTPTTSAFAGRAAAAPSPTTRPFPRSERSDVGFLDGLYVHDTARSLGQRPLQHRSPHGKPLSDPAGSRASTCRKTGASPPKSAKSATSTSWNSTSP